MFGLNTVPTLPKYYNIIMYQKFNSTFNCRAFSVEVNGKTIIEYVWLWEYEKKTAILALLQNVTQTKDN